MTPSPGLLMTLIVILALGLVLLAVALGIVWFRLRSVEAMLSGAGLRDLGRRLDLLEETARGPSSRPASADTARVWPVRNHPGPPVVRLAATAVRIDPAEPSAVSGPTLIAVPDLTAGARPHATSSVSRELGRRYGAIWELADAGEPADAIARATGQPVGQIELILALRRQAAAGAAEPRPT